MQLSDMQLFSVSVTPCRGEKEKITFFFREDRFAFISPGQAKNMAEGESTSKQVLEQNISRLLIMSFFFQATAFARGLHGDFSVRRETSGPCEESACSATCHSLHKRASLSHAIQHITPRARSLRSKSFGTRSERERCIFRRKDPRRWPAPIVWRFFLRDEAFRRFRCRSVLAARRRRERAFVSARKNHARDRRASATEVS